MYVHTYNRTRSDTAIRLSTWVLISKTVVTISLLKSLVANLLGARDAVMRFSLPLTAKKQCYKIRNSCVAVLVPLSRLPFSDCSDSARLSVLILVMKHLVTSSALRLTPQAPSSRFVTVAR